MAGDRKTRAEYLFRKVDVYSQLRQMAMTEHGDIDGIVPPGAGEMVVKEREGLEPGRSRRARLYRDSEGCTCSRDEWLM